MLINALVAAVHFLAAFGVFATILLERTLFKQYPTLSEAKLLQRVDMLYGLSAALVLLFGFLRVFYFEKGSSFYWNSPFFLSKIGVFFIVGILSIYPTVKFVSWNKYISKGKKPEISDKEYKVIDYILNLELIGLILIILTASMMAKGIGY